MLSNKIGLLLTDYLEVLNTLFFPFCSLIQCFSAAVHKTGMARLIEQDSGVTPPSCGIPRVKPEAEGNAAKAQGGAVNNLFTRYGNLPTSARPEPRVKQGTEIANLDRGVRMSRMMSDEGSPADPVSAPRAANDAGRANILKGRGDRSNLF